MAKYLLGIDNGGTVTKAALFDLDGSEVRVETDRSPFLAQQDGHAERNMVDLWDSNVRVISSLLRASGVSGKEIMAISLTGHGDGLYLLGEGGRILTNGILSTDRRAEEYVSRWYRDGMFAQVFPRTLQSMWAGQPAAILAWLRDHRPDVLRDARTILMCKDYIRYRLTGILAGEYTDMSGSGLLNVVDGTYDPTLLRLYGLERLQSKLPRLLGSAQAAGEVQSGVAEMTGLRAGTPVIAGMWDIVACSIANGVVDESRLCVVAGTWSINERISRTPPTDSSVFITARYCIPEYWLILEGSPTSASNLEWFLGRFPPGGPHGHGARTAYDVCNELVAAVRPESSNLIFFPFLFGSNAGPNMRAGLVGLESWHGKAEILAAIYEGVVFSHRVHVEKLARYKRLPPAVRLSGGAAQSRVWVQMFADILGLDVEVNTARETGALGAALCAGVGVGCFASFETAARAMVRIAQVVHPAAERVEIYNRKFSAYKTAVDACRSFADRTQGG